MGNLGEMLSEAIKPHAVFEFELFGYKLSIDDSIVTMWLVMAALIIISIVLTRKMKLIPEGKQNVAEMLVEFINNFTKGRFGHHWKDFAPYIGTILMFLALANIVSIFSVLPTGETLSHLTGIDFFEKIPHFEIRPPTKDISVTGGLAIISILVVLGAGIKYKGFGGWLKSFVKPSPVMLPFHVMDYFTRPLSLALRLYGNILGAFIIMELIYSVAPAVIPAAFSVYFDLFDGGIQAYIFVFLTSIYVSEAIE